MQKQTVEITKWLRERARNIRPNNLKIDDWVSQYVEECILHGKPVELLTQYCLSKDLETRYKSQGDKFIPLATEQDMFRRHVPQIIEVFKQNGVSVQWYITFNAAFVEEGRISEETTETYSTMIEGLGNNDELFFLNWEKDVLQGKTKPSQQVLTNFETLVPQQAFDLDLQNLLRRTKKYHSVVDEKSLREQACKKIACEAEEGRFIFSSESPFSEGNILIVPLEFPERLVFFEVLAPGFQKRIAPILPLYPWRMDASELKYE